MMSTEKKVLVVGHVCVDIINYCIRFPEEDTDVGSNSQVEGLGRLGNRCLDQQWQRGGNASNTSTVLSFLGCPTEFLGSLPRGPLLRYFEDDFSSAGVDTVHCPRFSADTPTSCVIINAENGSRTIIHSNRNLPEVPADTLQQIDLIQYSWVHFEGRNIEAVRSMANYIREQRSAEDVDIRISVELEKPHRQDLDSLLTLGDVVFVSKEYAQSLGFTSMEEAVRGLRRRASNGSLLVCAWADLGAAVCMPDGIVATSTAYPPPSIVDTLGAGDTFVAGVIWSLRRGGEPLAAIQTGCRIAGAKIGVKGWTLMKEVLKGLTIW